MGKYTEEQTREYYNAEDELYQSLWSSKGNLHWGYFTDEKMTLESAMEELNKKMLKLSGINQDSNVLDLGCGNGLNSIFINQETGAEVVGLDLSDVRIENAKKKATSNERIKFTQGTATELPFEDETFSHVWSQSTLYHVHNREKALKEIFRVLKKGGIFIFEDIVKPKPDVSDEAREHVYDRLLFDTEFSSGGYVQTLEELGFMVTYTENMSHHFARSYSYLSNKIEYKLRNNKNPEFHEDYRKLLRSYSKTPGLVKNDEVGWVLIVAEK